MTPGIGPRAATKLLERFGSADAVFQARRERPPHAQMSFWISLAHDMTGPVAADPRKCVCKPYMDESMFTRLAGHAPVVVS